MKFAIVVSLLLGIVSAAPGLENIQRRAACNRDNCYRALFGTRNVGQNARGSADCLSFFGSTVALAPTTVTTTSTLTIITGVTTVSSTTVSTVTSASVTLSTITSTTTSTTTTTQTPTLTILASATTTVTVTSTTTLLERRDLEGRVVVTTSPTTTAVGGIPAYASYCSGVVRYSSACACGLAITSSNTVVVPASTVTRTFILTTSGLATTSTTVTSTTTTVATATNAQTVTLTSTVTSTTLAQASLVTSTVTTTTSTVTVTSTTRIPSTTSATDPTTITVTPITTTSSTSTSTSIVGVPTFVACNFAAASFDPAAGGCSANCGCDAIGSRSQAFCNILPAILGQGCSSDSNCPAGQFCDTDVGQCIDGSACTSTYTPA